METVEKPIIDNDVQPGIINSKLLDQFESIISTISLFKVNLTSMQNEIRSLEKGVRKEFKHIKKTAISNKPKSKRAPSGFAKPTKVTKELCAFMNKTEGTEIARTDVTKALVSYIKENNLSYSENKQIIIPDDKLKGLLGIDNESKQLTYFNIQQYMNKHFCKKQEDILEMNSSV